VSLLTLTAPPDSLLPAVRLDETQTPEGDDVGTVRAHALEYVTNRRQLQAFTRTTYRTRWYLLLAFADHAGNPPLRRVTRSHLEAFLAAQNVAASTLRTKLSGLRAFFAWAVERGYIRADPTLGIVGPRKIRASQHGLTVGEVERVLAHAPDQRTRVATLLLVQEGLRISEAARLTTDRIDWDHRLLHITGKGGHQREVPLSDQTADELRRYLADSDARYGQAVIRSHQHPGRPITTNHLYRTVIDCFWDAGVKTSAWDGKCCHALRHTAAHELLEHGADISDLALFLGHAHVSTTGEYLRRGRLTGRIRQAQANRRYGGVR